MSTTGEPGATTSIRIRGTRSILASNEPLIVVDGVMDAISDLNDINSADIESVSVLKDAILQRPYGRAAPWSHHYHESRRAVRCPESPILRSKPMSDFRSCPGNWI